MKPFIQNTLTEHPDMHARLDDDPDTPTHEISIISNPMLVAQSAHQTHRRTAAKTLGYGLTYIGAISDMVQKAYGASLTLGIDDLSATLLHTQAKDTLPLTYLMSAAAAAAIQSYYLEKEFTLKLARKVLQLPVSEKPVAHGLKSIVLTEHNALFKTDIQLNRIEKSVLRLITGLGGSTRFITTFMGCGLISPVMLALKQGGSATLGVSITDFSQAIATDGDFLQRLYLINRLWRRSKLAPHEYSSDYVNAMNDYLYNGDEDNELHQCRTWQGTALSFLTANVLGTLAVGSDVGIAKFALDSFAEQLLHIDKHSAAVQGLWSAFQYSSLASLFLLMYSMDARSLANEVASWYEDRYHPLAKPHSSDSDQENPMLAARDSESSDSNSNDATSSHLSQCNRTARLMLAGLICLLGASLTAINGYSGNQYLFGQDNDDDTQASAPNYGIMALSLIIALTKFCQSLAVEGVYTKKGMMKTSCPCAAAGSQPSIGNFVPTLSSPFTSSEDLQQKLLGPTAENSV